MLQQTGDDVMRSVRCVAMSLLFLATVLAAPHFAAGKTKTAAGGIPQKTSSSATLESPARLTVILNGPFVLCDDGGALIRIFVPDVLDNPPGHQPDDPDLSHYMPGFTATLSEVALAELGKRPDPKDFTLYTGRLSTQRTALVETDATLDKVRLGPDPRGKCLTSSDQMLAYLSVPRPQKIVSMLADEVTITHDSVGKKDNFATRTALVYRSVYLSKVKVLQGGKLFWPQQGTVAFRRHDDLGILVFDMLRKQDDPVMVDPTTPGPSSDSHHPHAIYANGVMSAMSGINRTLEYPPMPKDSGREPRTLFYRQHGDCNSPQMLVCFVGSNLCP